MTPHIGQRITAQFDALTAQEQRVASFILDHFDDLAVYSAADLARLTGVSKSTVSRLFKRLGFESYRTVKDHARQLRNLGVPLVIDPNAMQEEVGAPFQRHLQREQDNLQRCLNGIAADQFAALVERLDSARHVVVIGFRNSYPLALHFRQQLIQARTQVRVVPHPNQSLAEEIVDLTEQDVVVLFGFRRRPAAFASLIDALERSPAKVALLADPTAVNFASQVTWFFETPLESLSAFDSYAAANSLICLIANGLLHRRLAEGRERISAISEVYAELSELEAPTMSVDWSAQ
ncbi:MurR/RpiR family transcriptional regulator [Halomonas sp. FeN2]|uniref:MurR/RpiR family transcriptional regulator n=1 Tax=Vreelandella neptunia TaxID=115551 RepID=A0ABZ0YHL1_9GAMM|nr:MULTISPECIES: MurR/RpiR family transcriptional regulator [Halomonas]MBF60212.1 MurR/RpiR family transcriptional regulator [Halomonas sp.]MDN3559627.1 MurR/RpiR family transcriptional regulator [Halomonas neptunia]UBR51064.1 MurR/RpiR family transcriptional regulator [Halomonas sp. FeN2]WQH11594.1 MurR/RpiR family transcriptional regulator [Halomonas neptunia]